MGQLGLSSFPVAKRWQHNSSLLGRLLRARQRKSIPLYSSSSTPICAGRFGTIFLGKSINDIMPVEYQASAERFLSNFAEGTSDYKLVKKACDLAWEGHYAQEPRKDGSPYFSHPLAVANILIEWGVGAKEVAAALCHDLIEDGKINGERITREFIEEKLGKRVAQLIEGVTELGKEPEFNGVEKPSDVDIFKKWLGYGAKDLGSLIIKLADRLHNMRTLAYTSEESQRLKSEETLKVYTRVADILGMWEVKRELEDLCFKYLHPEIYEQIMMKRTEIIAQNEDVIQNIIAEMQDGLTDLKMEIELFPEARFIYELYQRMEYRGLLLEELFPTDIWRINIVVPEKRDCHLVEGEIHDNLYPPVQGETYNYIAEPRPNGHQFLHSYVKVPRFGRLLIQIRDKEMQRNYKYGVVSKVNGRSDWFKEDFTWLKALMDYLKSEGVTENALYRMFAAVTEPIEVYTSQGKKIQLPFGATALDFAAQIHTKVFGKAKEAIINGRPTPLSTVLQDADEVWIVKGEETRPKLEWIDWIRTPRALKLLRADLRARAKRNKKELIGQAWALLSKEAMKYYLPAKPLVENEFFVSFIKDKIGCKDPLDFLERLIMGELRLGEVLLDFIGEYQRAAEEQAGKIKNYTVMVVAEDRAGLEEEIKGPLRELGINCALSFSHNYMLGDKKMARVLLTIEGIPGLARGIQRLQVLTILSQPRGVEKVIAPTDETIKKIVMAFIKGGEA